MWGNELDRDAIRVREPRRSCIVTSFHQNGDLSTGCHLRGSVRLQGRISEARRGRENEFASAFRGTFCLKMRKIDGKTGRKRKWMTLKRKGNAMKMRYVNRHKKQHLTISS